MRAGHHENGHWHLCGTAACAHEQLYRRTGVAARRYENAGGRFVADLETNAAGFVIRYPSLRQAEAAVEPWHDNVTSPPPPRPSC